MKRNYNHKLEHHVPNQDQSLAQQTSAIVKQIKSQAALNLSCEQESIQSPNIYLVSNKSGIKDRQNSSSTYSRYDYRKQRGNSGLKTYSQKKIQNDQLKQSNIRPTTELNSLFDKTKGDDQNHHYAGLQRLNQSVDVVSKTTKKPKDQSYFKTSQELAQALRSQNEQLQSQGETNFSKSKSNLKLASKHTVSSRQSITTPKNSSIKGSNNSALRNQFNQKSKDKSSLQRQFHLDLKFLNKSAHQIENRVSSQFDGGIDQKNVKGKLFQYEKQKQSQEQEMRIEDESQTEQSQNNKSFTRGNLRSSQQKLAGKVKSIESKNENDVAQKEKMKDLGNSYMRTNQSAKRKCTHKHPAPLTIKQEEQMILERMKQAQTEYMQSKQTETDHSNSSSVMQSQEKASQNRSNSKINIKVETQNKIKVIEPQVKEKVRQNSQPLNRMEMQQRLKYLYQRLGAVMRGYKARRIYFNNKQIRKIRVEFRDLIQFAYSLKVEISNQQNSNNADEAHIETTKQMLLTALRDLIQKRQQFAWWMDRLHMTQKDNQQEYRQQSPDQKKLQLEWMIESQPRFIQTSEFLNETQSTKISTQSRLYRNRDQSEQNRSRKDSKTRSQYKKQFMCKSRQEDQSAESRGDINKSIYQEEAVRAVSKDRIRSSFVKSPIPCQARKQEQKDLNSDLLFDTQSKQRTDDKSQSPKKAKINSQNEKSSCQSPIVSKSLIRAKQLVKSFKNENVESKEINITNENLKRNSYLRERNDENSQVRQKESISQERQIDHQKNSITPKRSGIKTFKEEYQSPYKQQPKQKLDERSTSKDFMKANIDKIKQIEDDRRVQQQQPQLSKSYCDTQETHGCDKIQNSKSQDQILPMSEQRPRKSFQSNIPRLAASKSPIRGESENKSWSRPTSVLQNQAKPKIVDQKRNSQGDLTNQQLETSDWIRKSNQNYIQKVLNTSEDFHYNQTVTTKQHEAYNSQSRVSSPSKRQAPTQYSVSKCRNEIKSKIVNTRYEHKKNYSDISGLVQSEQNCCINIEARPDTYQSRSPSKSPSRSPSRSPSYSPQREILTSPIRKYQPKFSPAKSQISEEASPNTKLQKIIERISDLKNADFKNPHIQKRGQSKGKPASLVKYQNEVTKQRSTINIIKCEEPSPEEFQIKSPDIINQSEISVSQIAESPVKCQNYNNQTYENCFSQQPSPQKQEYFTQDHPKKLETLDQNEINKEIDMFDKSRRCLNLGRSSNFNSFANSEVRDSGNFGNGLFTNKSSPKRTNPYLYPNQNEQQQFLNPEIENTKTQKENESTFRLCPQIVDSNSQTHSRVTSNCNSIKNLSLNQQQYSPTKTKPMQQREFQQEKQVSTDQFVKSPSKSPAKSIKSKKQKLVQNEKNVENQARSFTIDIVEAHPLAIQSQVNESNRTRRRSRGDRQTKSTLRTSTGRLSNGPNLYKRQPLNQKQSQIKQAYEIPVLQERSINNSFHKLKTPTSQMAIEFNYQSQQKESPSKANETNINSQALTPEKPRQQVLQTPQKPSQIHHTPTASKLAIHGASASTLKGKGSGYKRLSNQKRSKTANFQKPPISDQKNTKSSINIKSPKNACENQENMASPVKAIQQAIKKLQNKQQGLRSTQEQQRVQGVIDNLQIQVEQMNVLIQNN